jgi:hypothetical protein
VTRQQEPVGRNTRITWPDAREYVIVVIWLSTGLAVLLDILERLANLALSQVSWVNATLSTLMRIKYLLLFTGLVPCGVIVVLVVLMLLREITRRIGDSISPR